MPTYTYACTECGHSFDIRQSFTDDPLTDCPECAHGRLRKVIHPVGISFKGSGFYKTDSRSSGGASGARGDTKDKAAAGAAGSDSAASSSSSGTGPSSESSGGSSGSGSTGSSGSSGGSSSAPSSDPAPRSM